MTLSTPVAFIIFNRPDTTEKVFQAIRHAQPKKLLVIADGPRANRPDEAEKCAAARAVIDQVDWDCEILTNYSEVNLGCKLRVSSGIDWVFSEVEEAIILEDDCLPHPSFFIFCEKLLGDYRNDEKIMHISGTNVLPSVSLNSSYRFSRLVPIWGWATWRRAWQHCDMSMERWPTYKETHDIEYFGSQSENVAEVFQSNYLGLIDTWDAQWAFSCVVNQSLTIIPNTNLIQNIGFREDATHTKTANQCAFIPVEGVDFPLKKPDHITPGRDLDHSFLEFLNSENPISLRNKIKTIAKKILR
jgi:hypothetical protein